jgi:putative transposase
LPNQRWVADITYVNTQEGWLYVAAILDLFSRCNSSGEFQKQLAANNMIANMSSAGNCYDNAAMESFFHTLKTEHIYFEH